MVSLRNNLPPELKSPLAVVCHDAGASNLIFAWLIDWARQGRLINFEIRLMLSGPAKSAWNALNINLSNVILKDNIVDALYGASCVLTGTGWGGHIEHDVRKYAFIKNIFSVAVVDHWVNYLARFERGGDLVLPDVIWVSDHYAAKLAKNIFGDIPVRELVNVYLQEMIHVIPPVDKKNQNLLYVMEPLRNNWGREREGEFQALDYFAQKIDKIVKNKTFKITLRPHPSDPNGKYTDWINFNSHLGVSLDESGSLIDAIANAKWVVGAETFAMVVAHCAGRLTYSSLPPWAHRCRLPHDGILHLRDIV